jgi:hypothetical protein
MAEEDIPKPAATIVIHEEKMLRLESYNGWWWWFRDDKKSHRHSGTLTLHYQIQFHILSDWGKCMAMRMNEEEEAYRRRMRKHRERGDFMWIVERECMKHGRVVFIIGLFGKKEKWKIVAWWRGCFSLFRWVSKRWSGVE